MNIDETPSQEKEKKPPVKPTVHSEKRIALLAVAFIVFVSTTAGFFGGWIGSEASRSEDKDTSTGQQIISTESELISKIAKDVGPSVVSVSVTTEAPAEGFFGLEPTKEQFAGTGFIISGDGLVVTNRHLVPSDESEISITLADGTELTNIDVVGRTSNGDPLDIAFLKITDAKGKKLKAVKLGDSAKMEVGSRVVAIGNALGQFQNSVTTGIISGYGRDIEASDENGLNTETLQNLFQTDAAINQGNSGGPLVNANGEVIGVNTAVASEGAENIGFAIPINDVKGLIEGVLKTGELKRPYLGVRYVMLTDDIAYSYNLDIKRGAYVVSGSNGEAAVLPDSPAAKAGLQEEDIIIKINNETVDENNSLVSLVSKYKVDEEVTLTIKRGGKDQAVKVKLEANPDQ
jgi:serine protease Do